jgi:hypothetical protein
MHDLVKSKLREILKRLQLLVITELREFSKSNYQSEPRYRHYHMKI